RITEAKLSLAKKPLWILRDGGRQILNRDYGNWQAAAKNDPRFLLTVGFGTNNVAVWPPAKTVDTLNLVVFRRQLLPFNGILPIAIPDRFQRFIDNGVLKRAYRKKDSETSNPEAAKDAEAEFERDKEEINRMKLTENTQHETNEIPYGLY